jgi:hypothetical protein
MSTKIAATADAVSPAWSTPIKIRGEDGEPLTTLGAGAITTGTIAVDAVITIGTLGGASISIDGAGKRIVIKD